MSQSPDPISEPVRHYHEHTKHHFDGYAKGPGPWGYRNLMTEAGMLGQSLYLGAEACGLQGTGIGCFFDDGLHELFGLQDRKYQVLYQFTVGKGRPDNRISNEPAYPKLLQNNNLQHL